MQTYRMVVQGIDGHLGCVLPPQVVDAMNLRAGDVVHVVERSGGYVLMRDEDDFAEAMETFEQVRGEFRDAFRDLAR